MPIAEIRTGEPIARREKEPTPPTVIVYAGQSPRRVSFLQYVFVPTFRFESVPGGEESDDEDVISIAKDKIRNAIKEVKRRHVIKPEDRVVYIAADVKTRPLKVEDGQTKTVSLGRPQEADQVRETFDQMTQASKLSGIRPYYLVESGSLIHTEKGGKETTGPPLYHTVTIELEAGKVGRYATERGFPAYLNEFDNYYRSSAYSSGGAHPPISVADISAGLSIPVLCRLNAIAAIDGVQRDDPRFSDSLQMAIYHAGVGIQPETLRPLKPTIYNDIRNYPWLNASVANSLRENLR